LYLYCSYTFHSDELILLEELSERNSLTNFSVTARKPGIAEPVNTYLVVPNVGLTTDTLKVTKTYQKHPHNKHLNRNYRWKIILMCVKFRGSRTQCKIIGGPSTPKTPCAGAHELQTGVSRCSADVCDEPGAVRRLRVQDGRVQSGTERSSWTT